MHSFRTPALIDARVDGISSELSVKPLLLGSRLWAGGEASAEISAETLTCFLRIAPRLQSLEQWSR